MIMHVRGACGTCMAGQWRCVIRASKRKSPGYSICTASFDPRFQSKPFHVRYVASGLSAWQSACRVAVTAVLQTFLQFLNEAARRQPIFLLSLTHQYADYP